MDELCREEIVVDDLLLLCRSCLQCWIVGSSPRIEGSTHFPRKLPRVVLAVNRIRTGGAATTSIVGGRYLGVGG